MTPSCVALALDAALDIDAVRRLHDYADLDDAGVTRAFEQMRMQRYGHLRLPAYLLTIRHAACVVDNAGTPDIVALSASPDEQSLLGELVAALPQGCDTLVSWNDTERTLLSARALIHGQRLAGALIGARACPLVECLDGRAAHDFDAPEIAEAEFSRLTGLAVAAQQASALARTTATAVNRYRWWLRWQCVQGGLDAAERGRREQALAAFGAAAKVRA